jgi:signal transduction histidine kinase
MGWLRNAPIWSKLGLIMIVPTIATVVVGVLGLVDNYHGASDADRARTLAGLTAESGSLVHELQNERAASTLLLGRPSDDARATFTRQAAATDEAVKRYRLRRAALAGLPSDFRGQLNNIDSQLSELAKLREEIRNSSQQSASEPARLSNVVFRYLTLIEDLVSIRGSAAQLATDQALGANMRASAALSQAKEYLSQERVVVLQALLQKSMPAQLKVQFISKLTGQEQALRQFDAVAPPAQRVLYERTVTGADRREAENFQSTISSLTGDQMPDDIFTPAQWDGAMVGQANLVRKVETALDNVVVADAAALRDRLQRQTILQVGVLLSLLMLSIFFAWMVARSMARSLRELRHGALTVAQYGLPQAVARLRDPQLATQASPQQVAAQIAEPLPVRSRDEFGQVAEAFNAVHLEAVRTAAEQAQLRSSVSTMFVNLARRSQILVDRLIGHLDRLERGEEDPDRLSELFQLDHLATRMRRNDENLLVLAGADSTRIQREPAPLMDVLRAAQSEVEHYTRIEFGMIDRDVEIGAHSVNDMVHLIAELLDNATAFSPPDSAVVVEARRVGDRAVLLVEDRGIGISPDQMADLNERLANPPVVDVAVSRMMGLVVVARLAARHGVKVELRPARERGTIADLTLPASVLVPRALAGRSGVPIAGSRDGAAAARPDGTPPRSPFGPPLALESGPSNGSVPPPREPVNTGSAFPGLNAAPRLGAGPGQDGGLNGSASGPFAGPPNARPFSGAGAGATGLFSDAGPGAAGLFSDAGPGAAGLFGGSQPTNGAPTGAGTHAPSAPGRGQPPAWSDLIGSPGGPPAAPLQSGDRLPQRRVPQPPVPDGGAVDDGPVIPRQRLDSPERAQADVADARSPEAPERAPELPSRPVAAAPPAPPAWPPVPKPAAAEATGAAEAPHVPEVFASALDMTAEMPRVRVDWDHHADEQVAPNASAAGPTAGSPQRFADETMELPIFRELESAWFRTQDSAPQPSNGPPVNSAAAATPAAGAPATPDTAEEGAQATPSWAGTFSPAGAPAAVSPPMPEAEPVTAPEQPAPAQPAQRPAAAAQRPAAADWRTAADEGWQAASALAEDQDFTTTATGLPKRVPMSQLVPGGIEKGTVSAHKRTPEAVRGLLSAYHRGVQRGRTTRSDESKTPEHTAAGPQSSQGGKEQEA